MKNFAAQLLTLCMAFTLCGALMLETSQPCQATNAEVNTQAQDTLNDFRAKVADGAKLLAEAKGVLVFPRLYKAGLIVGGKYGDGELLVNDIVVDYYELMGLSWGWQIGGQRQALVMLFMTDSALAKFQKSSGWDIGSDSTIAVINKGAQAGISAANFNKPILVFALDQKGLMAGVSLQGSKITKVTK